MHIQKWILMFLLSGFIAAPAAAFKVKPGEWETEKWTNGYGSETTAKRKICLTPEQAEYQYDAVYDGSGALFESDLAEEGCKGKITKKRLNSHDAEAVCDYTSSKMKIKTTVKKASNTEIVETVSALFEYDDDGPSRSKGVLRTKKISEDETLIESRIESILFQGKKHSGVSKITFRYKKISDDEFIEHTTIRDDDKNCCSTMTITMVETYRYKGPVCTDPDEEKNDAQQKAAPDENPLEKANTP